MNPATKGRLIAAIALPLLLLDAFPSHAEPVQASVAATAAETMDHISIVVTGRGSPVFLIPGLSSPRAVWDGVVPELAKAHRVYLVQVNGFGGDAPGANLKPGILDGIVADLDGYIARNKIEGAAIVGHSLGGLVGLIYAKAHPGHLSRLMIVDSLPFYGMMFGPTATVAMVEPQGKAMRDQITATYGKPANPAAAEAIANHLALKPESRARVKAWVMAADPRVTGAAMYEDLTTDLRPDLAAIRTPVTLVYPWSTAVPKPIADALYKGAYGPVPAMTYVDIGDAAHFVMLDQPAAFAAALKAFVEAK
ncbi:MAG: alpha/beta hydrolase [Candidatus Sphingomonas phytovorans]|nr:alpha/beta hydrolase [Sphingomonas sp.]WEJ97985.1 MAG: alpha/beta hydrolase [Sphingomonas sp.]